MKILITGGAGFIGSVFVRLLLKSDCLRLQGLSPSQEQGLSPSKLIRSSLKGTVPELIVVDNLTYAGDLARLKGLNGKYKFYKTDICDEEDIASIFKKEKPEAVVHFAAESHVDRSITDASAFIDTNIKGTQVLLDASRKYCVKRLIHISTDEVYGETKDGCFYENSPLKPNSPYAASKAAADLLIKAYIRTYNFPAIIVRPSNNYGPWQYPEKLIPLAILKLIKKEKVPVYADGKNVREWLYVDDCAQGILQILEKGKIGEVYNIGSNKEKQNIEVVKEILSILGASKKMIQFVKDRPGHDIRYRLNSQKLFNETGWKPKVKFTDGIKFTVNWYLRHRSWLLSKG